MLINYDLYDLHALMVFLRQNTDKFSQYENAVRQIVSCLEASMQTGGGEANSIRKILMPFVSEEEQLSWALVENRYTANVIIIKNKAYYDILSAVLREMLRWGNDRERLYLLCDAVHNIPLLLADVKKPKKAAAAMIKDYQRKYDGDFLSDELKRL